MIRLTREFRFFWRSGETFDRSSNSWAGSGGSLLAAPFQLLRSTVTGRVDARTGYLVNIQVLDRAMAEFCNEYVAANANGTDLLAFIRTTPNISRHLPDGIQLLESELVVTPYLSLKLVVEPAMDVLLTEQCEFSAAHRLHSNSMTAEENRDYFGKCNNPAGHGHNYVVAVTVAVPALGDVGFSLPTFEHLIKTHVVDRLDHKHLNVDVPEFAGLNPTVENIAGVIWQWLSNIELGGSLRNVRVYETPKTWADFSQPMI